MPQRRGFETGALAEGSVYPVRSGALPDNSRQHRMGSVRACWHRQCPWDSVPCHSRGHLGSWDPPCRHEKRGEWWLRHPRGRQVSSRVGILQETGRILDALSIEVVQCIGQSDLPPSDQEDLVFVVAFLLESLSNQVKHFMFFLLLVESPAVKSAFVHTFPNGLVSETIGRRRVDLRRGKVKLPLQILCDLLQSPTLFEIKLSDEWTMPPPFLAGVRVGGTFGRLPLPIDWRSIG